MIYVKLSHLYNEDLSLMYSLQWHYALHALQCTLTLYSVHCKLYNIQYTLYTVQYTVYLDIIPACDCLVLTMSEIAIKGRYIHLHSIISCSFPSRFVEYRWLTGMNYKTTAVLVAPPTDMPLATPTDTPLATPTRYDHLVANAMRVH